MSIFSKKTKAAKASKTPAKNGFVKVKLTNSNVTGWKINGTDRAYYTVDGVVEVPAELAVILWKDKDYTVIG